jgi:hypothetical protein
VRTSHAQAPATYQQFGHKPGIIASVRRGPGRSFVVGHLPPRCAMPQHVAHHAATYYWSLH